MTARPGQLGVTLVALGLGACVQNGAFDGASRSTGDPEATSSSGTNVEPTGPLDSTSGTVTAGESTSSESTVTVEQTSETTAVDSSTGPGCADPPGDLCAPDPAAPGYQLCERFTTWQDAQAACEARCMRLVVLDEPESATIYAALRARMTQEDEQVDAANGDPSGLVERASWWIGGLKVDGQYVWLDGVPMPPAGTMGWSPGNPDVDANTACVVIGVFGKGADNGDWFDRDCAEPPHRFVCEPLP